MAPAWHCSGGRNGFLIVGLQARHLWHPWAFLSSMAQPGHRALCGERAWASATRGSLQQSNWGEKPQLWHVPCKETIHCWGSEPNPHPRLGQPARSDEAESRYFSFLEREHQENERDGNSSWCFGVTSLGDPTYSPRQGGWSSLPPAPSPSFLAPLCTQVPSTALAQRHQQSPLAVLPQPELPCSSPAPLCQRLNCHTAGQAPPAAVPCSSGKTNNCCFTFSLQPICCSASSAPLAAHLTLQKPLGFPPWGGT